ncbi:CoA transferase subunit A [Alicyclobacillus sp. ALC3]|uniref:CoA transferase subunit A n=1 Tax=Alicyclobacillus sp. ALC3 TaxID=2796143 RepID=UPI002378728F|nr:CoA transferase subunit A [Alicyclobacillus sp. ALC3]WDL95914.1 CoA transferase subunit A [Alicyclobacillus sp. ALC3]
MKSKIATKEEAIAKVHSGMTLMVGGFGLVGCPLELVAELHRQGQTELTIVSNNIGEPGKGLDVLLQSGRIRKAIGSFFTSNPNVARARDRGELLVELMPQGTLAEAMRSAGAGLGGFYTRTGVGTLLAEGQELRDIDGELYLFVKPLHAHVALIRAHQADHFGNLVYRKTARNFNPVMATAAELVIALVDDIVEPGRLDAERITTPHLYVDLIVQRSGTGA